MPLVTEKVFPYPENINYKQQAVEVPGTRKPGQTGIYRSAIWPTLVADSPNVLQTMDDIFLDGLKAGRDAQCLGRRPIVSTKPLKYANHYVWETYGQVDDRRRDLGSALLSMFNKGELKGEDHRTVGIWAQNRPEWQITEIACHSYGCTSVSLYDTLGKDSVAYIINHAALSVVFTSADHIPALIKLAPVAKALKLIVSLDDLTPEAKKILGEWCDSHNLVLKEMRELEAEGRANRLQPIRAQRGDLASICYTSGTTGNPKGVMLTHNHLASAVQTNLYGLRLPEGGSMLSYLPLAHIYGRVCEACTLAIGAKIGYFTGDPLRLLEDCQILRPNFFPSVPRVLNRVYQAAMTAGSAPGLRGTLFKKAVDTKLERLRTTGVNTHAFWDKLVFRKISGVLGGQLKVVTTGSAPISPEVMDFLKIAFACDTLEGYGMTETAATCSKTLPGDPTSSGTVGPPQHCNEVKLIDVPAMGYTSTDQPFPRGELLIRGHNCFSVYYKDEKNTSSTVDSEGWVHTGDVAAIDECGRIKIIDRVKNIMKLSQGEYVALEKIESLYGTCPVVAQLYVHGDSLQPYLIGVVVPDAVQLASIASSLSGKTIAPTSLPELVKACNDPKVAARVLELLNKEAKVGGLKGFEMLKRIHLTMDPFTIEDGTLTPTFKLRRKDAYNKFKKELDNLYALGDTKL